MAQAAAVKSHTVYHVLTVRLRDVTLKARQMMSALKSLAER